MILKEEGPEWEPSGTLFYGADRASFIIIAPSQRTEFSEYPDGRLISLLPVVPGQLGLFCSDGWRRGGMTQKLFAGAQTLMMVCSPNEASSLSTVDLNSWESLFRINLGVKNIYISYFLPFLIFYD